MIFVPSTYCKKSGGRMLNKHSNKKRQQGNCYLLSWSKVGCCNYVQFISDRILRNRIFKRKYNIVYIDYLLHLVSELSLEHWGK